MIVVESFASENVNGVTSRGVGGESGGEREDHQKQDDKGVLVVMVMVMFAVVMAAVRILPQGEEDKETEHNHAESAKEGDGVELGDEKVSNPAGEVEGDDGTTPEDGGEGGESVLEEFHDLGKDSVKRGGLASL